MIDELKDKGWYLSPQGLESCTDGLDKVTISAVIRRALDSDLKEIGASFLSEEIYKNKVDFISGPCVLQVQKIKNVSTPKYETSSHGPGLLRVHVTDGKTTVSCLQWGYWKSISIDTPSGTKILLKNNVKVPVQNGILLLEENHITVLGGQVTALFEKWELSKRLATHVRRLDSSDDGPPPWIPFGKSINYRDSKTSTNDFKSLEQEGKDQKEDNVIFKQQRQANIAEVSKAKEGKSKVFGGGKEKPIGNKQEIEKPNQFKKNQTSPESSSTFSNYSGSRKNFSNDFTQNRSEKEYSYNQKSDSNRKPEREQYKKYDAQQDDSSKQSKPVYAKSTNQSYGNNTNPSYGNNNYNRSGSQNYGNRSANEKRDFPPHTAKNGSDVSQMMSNLRVQESRNSFDNFKPGTDVLARYWEDMRFYPAKIHAVGENGTCMVHFVEYGNYEEVRMNDIRPISSNWENDRRPKNSPHQSHNFVENDHFTGVLEFRRGGNKPYVHQPSFNEEQDQDRRSIRQQNRSDYRPPSKFYQMPYNRQTH